ncbi:MAG TPA: hypothetical protein VK184_03600 [Nostocaceae cyanobacterium]|nr:hypothetical protein [Nostocaceae cyanobacterium]
MKNVSFLIASILIVTICNLLTIKPVKAEQVICPRNTEQDSKIKKNAVLDKFGISIEIPINHRLMARTDGSIEILDNGTYEWLACLMKNPNACCGAGFGGISITTFSGNFFYSNVYMQVPNRENAFIIWKKEDEDINTVKLRFKTSKGATDVEYSGDYSIEDYNVKSYIESLIELSANIQVLQE